MPHDRRTERVLLAMMGLVGVAVSVGCMRTSTLRSSAGVLPELSPAGELHPVAGEATPGTTSPPPANAATSWARNASTPVSRPSFDPGTGPDRPATGPSPGGSAAKPTPGGTDPGDATAPPGQPSASPAPADERPASPTTSPTPLLDAEIRRAQAVTRQQIESLKAADTPTPVAKPVDTPPNRPESTPGPASAAEPKPAESAPDVLAPLPLAASPQTAIEPEPAGLPGGIAVPPLTPIDTTAAGSEPPATVPSTPSLAPDTQPPPPNPAAAIPDVREGDHLAEEPMPTRSESGVPDDPKVVAQHTGDKPSNSSGPRAVVDREERPPLQIAALRLCSRVKDFGSVVAVNPDALKPGRPVLVYCEIAGVEYQPRDDAFISRLAAHLELRSGTNGPVAWEQALGTAEDKRRRHDYYVSYHIEWPRTLEPGTYRLRLIQTDLIGNRVASSEIPVTIVR